MRLAALLLASLLQDPTDEQIREWIGQLGAPEWEAREEATQRLVGTGERAIPFLEEREHDPDAEVRARVGMVLRALRRPQESRIFEAAADLAAAADADRWNALIDLAGAIRSRLESAAGGAPYGRVADADAMRAYAEGSGATLTRARSAGGDAEMRMAVDSVVVVDGDLTCTQIRNSVVVVTGNLTASAVMNSVVIVRGTVQADIAMECVILNRGTATARFARRSILAGAVESSYLNDSVVVGEGAGAEAAAAQGARVVDDPEILRWLGEFGP